jgi:hypothetical protein
MFDAAILKNMSRTTYNAGHPIRVSKQYLDKVMKDNISDTLFLKIYETVCAGYQAYETYFIGEIK